MQQQLHHIRHSYCSAGRSSLQAFPAAMRTLLVPLCPFIIAAVCSITVTAPFFVSSRVFSCVRSCCLSWQAQLLSIKNKFLDMNFILPTNNVDKLSQRSLLVELMPQNFRDVNYAAGPLWHLYESASSAAALLASVDHSQIWDRLCEEKKR